MAVIRAQQGQAFDGTAMDRFRGSAADHARAAFPKHMRYLSEAELAQRVDDCIAKAAGYGISKQGGILLVLDLTFLLGFGFDIDPQLPWAGEILGDASMNEAVKLDRLHRRSMEYLREVSGAKNEHIDAAQVRARASSIEDLPEKPGPEAETVMARKLHEVFPEKFAYLGRERVVALMASARKAAGAYGIAGHRGVTVYLGLMYLLGSAFDTDSLYTWASKILRNEELGEAQKVNALYVGSMDFLAEWCG